jgi:hypothetical protein
MIGTSYQQLSKPSLSSLVHFFSTHSIHCSTNRVNVATFRESHRHLRSFVSENITVYCSIKSMTSLIFEFTNIQLCLRNYYASSVLNFTSSHRLHFLPKFGNFIIRLQFQKQPAIYFHLFQRNPSLVPPCELVNLDSFAANMMVYLTWYPSLLTQPLRSLQVFLVHLVSSSNSFWFFDIPQKVRHSSLQATSLSAQVMVLLAWYPHSSSQHQPQYPLLSAQVVTTSHSPLLPDFTFRQGNGLLDPIPSVVVSTLTQ